MHSGKYHVGLMLTSILALFAAFAAPASWATAPPLPVTIVLHDHGFGFRNIGFRATRIKLDVKNEGRRKHALAIVGTDRGDDQLQVITKVLRPGASTQLTLRLPPGDYKIYSPVDHDSAHGLSAPMKFTEPSPLGSDGAEMDRVFYNY